MLLPTNKSNINGSKRNLMASNVSRHVKARLTQKRHNGTAQETSRVLPAVLLSDYPKDRAPGEWELPSSYQLS